MNQVQKRNQLDNSWSAKLERWHMSNREKKSVVSGVFVGADFELSKEHWWHRLAMSLSDALERSSFDDEFDKKVFVACDDERLASALIKSPQARAAVLRLFEAKASSIVCHEGVLSSVVAMGRQNTRARKALKVLEATRAWGADLDELGSELARAEESLGVYESTPGARARVRFNAAVTVVVALGLAWFAWFAMSKSWEQENWWIAPVPWALGGALAFGWVMGQCALALKALRRSAWLPKALGYALGMGLVMGPIWSMMLIRAANENLPSYGELVEWTPSVQGRSVKVKGGYKRVFDLSPPDSETLAKADLSAWDLSWRAVEANSEWTRDMEQAKRARAWIQKGALGYAVLRRVEPCLDEESCKPR